jgi:hypothetical protein
LFLLRGDSLLKPPCLGPGFAKVSVAITTDPGPYLRAYCAKGAPRIPQMAHFLLLLYCCKRAAKCIIGLFIELAGETD